MNTIDITNLHPVKPTITGKVREEVLKLEAGQGIPVDQFVGKGFFSSRPAALMALKAMGARVDLEYPPGSGRLEYFAVNPNHNEAGKPEERKPNNRRRSKAV